MIILQINYFIVTTIFMQLKNSKIYKRPDTQSVQKSQRPQGIRHLKKNQFTKFSTALAIENFYNIIK